MTLSDGIHVVLIDHHGTVHECLSMPDLESARAYLSGSVTGLIVRVKDGFMELL